MALNLFDDEPQPYAAPEVIAPGAVLLRGFVQSVAIELMQTVEQILLAAPLRHLVVPGGRTMSVAMSNCGALGWVSDSRGYRYSAIDPLSGRPWPLMPTGFLTLASSAALAASFEGYAPNACLINCYEPGARMGLHQDRDEGDLSAPIVSVSLGLPAMFLFGGSQRKDKITRWPLLHGDVVVWGGPSRLAFHGVAPLKDSVYPALGARRVNLTFRCVRLGA